MGKPPVSDDIARAFADFYRLDSARATDELLNAVFAAAGYPEEPPRTHYMRERDDADRISGRVFRMVRAAADGSGDPGKLLDGLLIHLRADGIFDGQVDHRRQVDEARRAFAPQGWLLTRDGYLVHDGPIYFRTGGRQALDEAIARLRRAEGESLAQISFARSLIHALLPYVLRETGTPFPAESTYDHVWRLALEQLGLLPDQVPDVPGRTAVQRVLQSSREVASQIERLWKESTGPDGERTLPAGATREVVLLMIREVCVFAEFVLAVLNRRKAVTVPAERLQARWYTEDELVQRRQIIAEEERRRAMLLRERAMPA